MPIMIPSDDVDVQLAGLDRDHQRAIVDEVKRQLAEHAGGLRELSTRCGPAEIEMQPARPFS